jgi:hypothetical protein
VISTADAQEELELLAGRWKVVSVFDQGDPEENITVDIQLTGNSPGSILITDVFGNLGTANAILSKVGNRLAVSIENKDESIWQIFVLSFTNANQSLEISPLDLERIRADIEDDVITGEVSILDLDEYLLELSASGLDLAAYLGSHAELFDTEVAIILTRQ